MTGEKGPTKRVKKLQVTCGIHELPFTWALWLKMDNAVPFGELSVANAIVTFVNMLS